MGIGERPPLLNVLPLPATLGTPITEPTAIVSVDLIITTLRPVSSSHSDHFLSKKKKFVLFSCFSRCRLYLIDSAMGTCPVFSYVNATFLSCPIDCASLSPKVRRIEKKTNKREETDVGTRSRHKSSRPVVWWLISGVCLSNDLFSSKTNHRDGNYPSVLFVACPLAIHWRRAVD